MTSTGSFPPSPSGGLGSVLAHQGGWDEVLLVVGPLALVASLLWVANRRVSAQLEEARADQPVDGAGGEQGDGERRGGDRGGQGGEGGEEPAGRSGEARSPGDGSPGDEPHA